MSVYYIAPNGSDGAVGDIGHPWLTIGKANATLQAGDTVYFREGTYGASLDYIAPVNNGSAGNYITYARYQQEAVALNDCNIGIDLRGKHHIKVDGLRFVDVVGYWIYMRGAYACEHNIIQNCYFSDMDNDSWAGTWLGDQPGVTAQCNYNQFLNNKFHAHCHPQNIFQFNQNASYNLIEGNKFYYGPHEAIGFYAGDEVIGDIKFNVIRGNYIENRWHTGLNIYSHSERNLIENNVIVDCGEDHLDNACGSQRDRENPRWVHGSIQLGGPKNIIRRNVIVNCGMMSLNQYAMEWAYGADSVESRIYHNTFCRNYRAIYTTTAESLTDVIIKNNILCDSMDYEIQWDVQGVPRDNYFIHNNIFGASILFYPTGIRALPYLEENYPTYWRGNIAANPLFENAEDGDFRLQSESPCIDAGDWLTMITSGTGSGTSFVVADAGYFCDGWGIIDGDVIQLAGQTERRTITNVNYATNTITVDLPLSWNQGDGVALAYNGNAPDMGAYEQGDIMAQIHSISIPLSITEIPDFSMASVPSSGTVQKGQSTAFNVTISALYGFVATVKLTVTGLPTGVTAAFDTDTITPGQTAVLTIVAAVSATAGNYTLTVTGTEQV